MLDSYINNMIQQIVKGDIHVFDYKDGLDVAVVSMTRRNRTFYLRALVPKKAPEKVLKIRLIKVAKGGMFPMIQTWTKFKER